MTRKHSRVFLIHALRESQEPAWRAFERGWSEAQVFNLIDDSLAVDLAAQGSLTQAMIDRFVALGRYAEGAGADGILFTCSAFGPAISAVQKALRIPVLRPNEAAFEEALGAGRRIGLMVTFAQALPPLKAELAEMAVARGASIEIVEAVASGALEALQAGQFDRNDKIVMETGKPLPAIDVLVLCQFSLARAATVVAAAGVRHVLTTPDAAVSKLRRLLEEQSPRRQAAAGG